MSYGLIEKIVDEKLARVRGSLAELPTTLVTVFAAAVHATRHQAGGADSIKLDDLAAPDDNTDLNALTTKHGLMPKGTGSTTTFYRSDMTQATPPGTGDVVGPSVSVDGEGALFDGTTGKLLKRATGTGIVRRASGVDSVAELSGDATTSGSNALTLANSGVSAATYGSAVTIPIITFDAKGRATSASEATLTGAVGASVTKVLASPVTFANNTLADITGFVQAVLASETWVMDGWFYLANASTVGDFKYSVTTPASPTTIICGGHRLQSAPVGNTDTIATSYGNPGSPSAGIAAAGVTSISLTATLINGANAGNFQVQGAQQATDSGNVTTLAAGSWVRFTRVA